MIRDPSDGSVKPATDARAAGIPVAGPMPPAPAVKPSPTSTSGLRDPSPKSDYQERLERSREWLRTHRTNPERTARLMGDGDHDQHGK